MALESQGIARIASMLPNNQVRVPSTRVVSQSTVSSDITDKFTTAASSETLTFGHGAIFMALAALLLTTSLFLELNTGQLVKDEYFTLFEAVGALEVCVAV